MLNPAVTQANLDVRKCTLWRLSSEDSDQPAHVCSITTGHYIDYQVSFLSSKANGDNLPEYQILFYGKKKNILMSSAETLVQRAKRYTYFHHTVAWKLL